MSSAEKMLSGLFILALLGWIFGPSLKINEATVAVTAMSACLVLGIITWDDVLKSKGPGTL